MEGELSPMAEVEWRVAAEKPKDSFFLHTSKLHFLSITFYDPLLTNSTI
jgi:hypothetical protein